MGIGDSSKDRTTPADHDVAIIGMGCVMPGAPDLETFWANIVDGVDSVTEVPTSRWDPALHFDPDYDPAEHRSGKDPKAISKWGGFIPQVGFDALAWGIPPTSLASIDPAQLLALKVAAAALDDAGYGPEGTAGGRHRELDRDRTSLVYATGSGGATELPAGFLLRLLLRSHRAGQLPADLDAFLPELTEDGLPGVLTSLIAGRVANRLDLGGKNLTVDSACASVLAALDIACSELIARSSDTVLCGGVDLHNGLQDFVSFTAAGALSRSGRCRSFDASADGMTLGEGAGCVVLKRLEDAQRHDDRIYAVVKGVAASSDGRHLGLTAPRQEGQVKAVRRAYAAAAVSPGEVGLLEAHGTGTPAGDRTELATMTETFSEAGATPQSVVLGTVKSNIGHIKCASAVASLIKAAKATYHGVLPPTLHITEPTDAWQAEKSPFVFLDRARPWLEDRRVVGVSAFGFGGTNFHAILENPLARAEGAEREAAWPTARPGRDWRRAAMPASGRPHWPAELFLFRAPTPAALDERLAELSARLADELEGVVPADRWRLRDIAAAESTGGDGPVQLAVVASSLGELADRVLTAWRGVDDPDIYRRTSTSTVEPQVAFLFSAPTEARPGMGADVLVAFPQQRGAARRARGWDRIMFPPQAFRDSRERQTAAFAGVAERATAIMSTTLERTLVGLGIAPTCRVAPSERIEDHIRELAEQGIRVFVEIGPGQRLTERVAETLPEVPHVAAATDRPGQHGLVSLVHALGSLAVAGVEVDVAAFHAGRGSQPDRWRQPDKTPGWIVDGHCARSATGESLPKGLHPAHDAPELRVTGVGHHQADTEAASGDAATGDGAAGDLVAVTEYLRMVHGIIATGADLVRAHAASDAQAPSGLVEEMPT